MPPVVIPHSDGYFSCPTQKTHFNVGTDASFSATVQVSSVLRKSACLNGLGEVATLGEGSASLGGTELRIGGGEGPPKSV